MKRIVFLFTLAFIVIFSFFIHINSQKIEAVNNCNISRTVPIDLIRTTQNGTATNLEIRVRWSAISDILPNALDPDVTTYENAYLAAYQGDTLRGRQSTPIFIDREVTLSDKTVVLSPTNFSASETGQANLEIYLMVGNCSISNIIEATVDSAQQGNPENRVKGPGETCSPGADTCEGGGRCEETGAGSGNFQCTCNSENQCPSDRPYCNQKNNSSNLFFCEGVATRADQLSHEGFEGYFTRVGDSKKITSINEKRERRVTFHVSGLSPNEDYWICGQPTDSGCSDKEERFIKVTTDSQGKAKVDLCGDGANAFKGGEEICDDDRDYFHGFSTYRVSVMSHIDFRTAIGYPVPLVVEPFYPGVKIGGIEVIKPGYIDEGIEFENINTEIKGGQGGVQITMVGSRPREDKEERNNYQIVLQSATSKYKEEECVIVTTDNNESKPATFGLFSDDKNKDIPSGIYDIKIHDQKNEDDFYVPGQLLYLNPAGAIARAAFGTKLDIGKNACDGGYLYYTIRAEIKHDKNTSLITVKDIEVDPDGIITRTDTERFGPLPCTGGLTKDGEFVTTKDAEDTNDQVEILNSIVECTEYNTALGIFGTNPLGFISSFGTWIFRIAALATFGILLYAGFIFQTSRGDKEKIGKAREMITAAITGLIFIILSVSILQIIGIDILKIPGFTNEPQTSEQTNP